jgi:DNA mismatch endonuclease (patch repair protein)
MAAVKSGTTVPELQLRRALHARGLRYRLHVKGLAGKPDLVFPKHRAVLFVHGCFWHGHDCGACRIPQTNREYWTGKIARNVRRDRRNVETLTASGLRIATVWECALRGPRKLPFEEVSDVVFKWLGGGEPLLEVGGAAAGAGGKRFGE